MSEETKVKPALTPEEWARWVQNRRLLWPLPMTPEAVAEYGQRAQTIELREFGFWVTNSRYGSQGYADSAYAHQLAALALHGQPFGFTREDVTRLRLLLAEGWPMATAVAESTGLTDAWAVSLADRIAALLPPEP